MLYVCVCTHFFVNVCAHVCADTQKGSKRSYTLGAGVTGVCEFLDHGCWELISCPHD